MEPNDGLFSSKITSLPAAHQALAAAVADTPSTQAHDALRTAMREDRWCECDSVQARRSQQMTTIPDLMSAKAQRCCCQLAGGGTPALPIRITIRQSTMSCVLWRLFSPYDASHSPVHIRHVPL